VEGENTVPGNADRLERMGVEGFARYAFTLEFPDGRWDVAEQELVTEPRVGDLVWFDGAPWQIRGHRVVPRRTSAGGPHDFLACTPAA
jgi:hypothetical protein